MRQRHIIQPKNPELEVFGEIDGKGGRNDEVEGK
jgi:hypothetical protein